MSEKDIEWIEQVGDVYWNPVEHGKILVGAVVGIKTEGNYGKQYVIRDNKNANFTTPSHKVLQSKMSNVEALDVVKIEFTGTEPSKKGKPTRIYKVSIAKPKEAVKK